MSDGIDYAKWTRLHSPLTSWSTENRRYRIEWAVILQTFCRRNRIKWLNLSKKNGSFCNNQLNSQSTFILNCIFYFDWILEPNRFAHIWRIDLFSLQQFFKCRKYSCSIPKHHNEIASDKYSVQKLEKQEEIDRFSHEIESISQSFVQCALSKSNEFFFYWNHVQNLNTKSWTFYRSKANTTIQTERRAILSVFVSFGLQIHSIEISKTSNMPCTPPQNGSKSQ